MKRKYQIVLASIVCFCVLLVVYFIDYDRGVSENITSVLTENETTIENEANTDAEMADTNSEEVMTEETTKTEETTETEEISETEESTSTEETLETETSSEEVMVTESKSLVIYKNGFSYEELPEDVINRIYGLSYKEDCTVPYEELRYVNVLYYNFEDEVCNGEIICNKAIAQDLVEIFYELYEAAYPIEQIRLIDEYNADDDLSCLDNNTSCFNYRVVEGSTKLSKMH